MMFIAPVPPWVFSSTMNNDLITTRKIGSRSLGVCILALLFAYVALGQSTDNVRSRPRYGPNALAPMIGAMPSDVRSTSHSPTPLHVDVDLVLVPVTVSDSMNRAVTSLKKEDFALYEGNKQQEIRYFSTEDDPISIAILLDVSKSMSNKIETERAAI